MTEPADGLELVPEIPTTTGPAVAIVPAEASEWARRIRTRSVRRPGAAADVEVSAL